MIVTISTKQTCSIFSKRKNEEDNHSAVNWSFLNNEYVIMYILF